MQRLSVRFEEGQTAGARWTKRAPSCLSLTTGKEGTELDVKLAITACFVC